LADGHKEGQKLPVPQLFNGGIRVRALDFSPENFISGTFLEK
jgi:hypothetical protein